MGEDTYLQRIRCVVGYLIPACCLLFCASVFAQTETPPTTWPNETTIPDFSGVWQKAFPGDTSLIPEPPLSSWGLAAFETARPIQGPRTTSATEANAAELACLPMGIPAAYYRPRPFEIIQLSDRAIMLFEVSNFWRVIHMDGRDFPEVPLHTWNGYSIGHYEGDTLVIETRHVRGWEPGIQRWIDRLGHPISDEVTIIERIRRVNEDTLENVVTIDDPIAYERSFTGTLTFDLREGFEIAEFICQELMLSALPEMRPEQKN